jgi:hypothetical protein
LVDLHRRLSADLFSQAPYTTAQWEGRHRFRLFDEFFTHSLRGDEIIPRDEVTDVAQILDRYGRSSMRGIVGMKAPQLQETRSGGSMKGAFPAAGRQPLCFLPRRAKPNHLEMRVPGTCEQFLQLAAPVVVRPKRPHDA